MTPSWSHENIHNWLLVARRDSYWYREYDISDDNNVDPRNIQLPQQVSTICHLMYFIKCVTKVHGYLTMLPITLLVIL